MLSPNLSIYRGACATACNRNIQTDVGMLRHPSPYQTHGTNMPSRHAVCPAENRYKHMRTLSQHDTTQCPPHCTRLRAPAVTQSSPAQAACASTPQTATAAPAAPPMRPHAVCRASLLGTSPASPCAAARRRTRQSEDKPESASRRPHHRNVNRGSRAPSPRARSPTRRQRRPRRRRAQRAARRARGSAQRAPPCTGWSARRARRPARARATRLLGTRPQQS